MGPSAARATEVAPPVEFDEADLPPLLAAFYDKVRADDMLGPVFGAAVDDWPAHLGRLEAFWSSVMLGSGRYKGQPVAVHLTHAARIGPAMFDRWLALWASCTDERLPPAVAAELQAKARRIAESLALALTHATPAQRAARALPVRTHPAAPSERATPASTKQGE